MRAKQVHVWCHHGTLQCNDESHEVSCCHTRTRLLVEANDSWNGNSDYEFCVHGFADSEYAKEQTTRRSVNGWCVFLHNVQAVMRGKGMPVVELSLTEAKPYAAMQCAQDMLYVM